MTVTARAGRLPQVDLLKALAAHLIVWHHLAFYGPMSDHLVPVWPALVDGLAEHGRLAVTVFLVTGGFLAARSLAPDGRLQAAARPLELLAGRWWRLVAPFAVVLVGALVANLVASRWMHHPSVEVPAGVATWLEAVLAHVLLLHDLLGVPALTAGAWYVAIDFQLYALMLFLLLADRGTGWRWTWNRQLHGPVLMALVGAASLFVFNRDPAWDIAAPYFAGAYALGALVAWWAPRPSRRPWLVLAFAGVALALAVEWRDRVAVAAVVAAVLALPSWLGTSVGTVPRPVAPWRARVAAWIGGQADRSYALFLVHFPIALVVNAAFTCFASPAPAVQGLGLAVAWLASVVAAAHFHARVERPLHAAWRAWRSPAGRTLPAAVSSCGPADRSVLGA